MVSLFIMYNVVPHSTHGKTISYFAYPSESIGLRVYMVLIRFDRLHRCEALVKVNYELITVAIIIMT